MSWFHTAIAILSSWEQNGTNILRGVWVLGAMMLVVTGSAQAGVLVTDISFTARSDGQGHVVRVQSEGRIEAYGMPETVGSNRLKWVLYNTDLHESYQESAPKGPVKRYTTERKNGHLILHLYLKEDRDVIPEAYRDGVSDDLLLNLAVGQSKPVARASGSASSSGPSSGAIQQIASQGGLSQEAKERWKLDKIVIDPGHGGKDPGAQAHGVQEKDIVLEIAHKLGDYIENRLGVEVVYTRTDDRFIELEKRGEMANQAGAKLFISLHANASRSAAARGTETYFLGRHKSEAARKVMERENSVIRYEDNPGKYDDYDEEALVSQTLTQSTYLEFSQELASQIQSQFEERVKRKSRGVHQAGFYVLWSASMPSILVELGFLTNPNEVRYLKSDRGQTYLASALFRAVRNYKAKYEKGIVARE